MNIKKKIEILQTSNNTVLYLEWSDNDFEYDEREEYNTMKSSEKTSDEPAIWDTMRSGIAT